MIKNAKNQNPFRINWLATAGIFSALYLIALGVFLIPETSLCSAGETFIQRLLACRSLNELGDFLAGAFAPVAFLWLVAAVLIQAQELRAQREELAMTRQELADSREVMREHAEQARNQALQAQRQADFIGEQTANLKRQSDDDYRSNQDRVFDELLQSAHKSLLYGLSRIQLHVPTDQGTIMVQFPDFKNKNYIDAFIELSKHLTIASTSFRKLQRTADWPINMTNVPELLETITIIQSMENELSIVGKIRLASLNLKNTENSLLEIIEAEKAFTSSRS